MHHIALLVVLLVSAVAAVAFAVAVVVLSRKLLDERRRCIKISDSWTDAYHCAVNARLELEDKLSADLRTEQARTQQAENRARLANERADRAERQVRHLEAEMERSA